jgi:hypothetical protein
MVDAYLVWLIHWSFLLAARRGGHTTAGEFSGKLLWKWPASPNLANTNIKSSVEAKIFIV